MSLGDSRTQAGTYQPILAADLAADSGGPTIVANGGLGWGTVVSTEGSRLPICDPTRLAGLLALYTGPVDPSDVVISLGVNDGSATAVPSEADFETAYLYIMDTVHAKWPGARVWIAAGQWSTQASDTVWNNMATWIANVQAARSSFVSPGPDERTWFKPNVATYAIDGLHWSGTVAGATAAASEWRAVLGY